MRITSILLAVAAATLAWSATAQPAGGDGTANYYAELDRQCPAKLLSYLSAGNLRDGLDDWISSLPQDGQTKIRQAEQANCAAEGGGAACVNTADINAADAEGLTSDLASSICGAFLRCRSQGDCDHAR